MGSHRVRHDWSNLAATAASPYPILLPLQPLCKNGKGKASNLFARCPEVPLVRRSTAGAPQELGVSCRARFPLLKVSRRTPPATWELWGRGWGALLFILLLFPRALPWLLGRELGWDRQVPTTPWTRRSRTGKTRASCRAVTASGPTLVLKKVCSQKGRRLSFLHRPLKIGKMARQCSSPAAPARPAPSVSAGMGVSRPWGDFWWDQGGRPASSSRSRLGTRKKSDCQSTPSPSPRPSWTRSLSSLDLSSFGGFPVGNCHVMWLWWPRRATAKT